MLQTTLLTIVGWETLVHAMEEASVAHNRTGSPLAEETLTHVEAQQLFAELINKLGSTTTPMACADTLTCHRMNSG